MFDKIHWEQQTPLRLLCYVFAATLLFRLYGLYIVKILNNDTIYYLKLVDYFTGSGIVQGMKEFAKTDASPFYPMIIYGLSSVLGSMLSSAVAVSFIFGTLCVIPFFITAHHLFDRRDTLIASLLFAANSYVVRYSIWVVREMPALCFFFSSTAALTSSRLSSKSRWIWFGTLAFLAVLLRAEYVVIYLVSAAAYLTVSKHWKPLALLLAGLAAAYLALYLVRGEPFFELIHRIVVQRISGRLMSVPYELVWSNFPNSLGKLALAVLKSIFEIMALMTPLAGVLSVIGLAAMIKQWPRATRFQRLQVITIASTIMIYTTWEVVCGYFTKRFLIIPGCLLFMLTGPGITVIHKRFSRYKSQAASIAITLLLVSVTLHTMIYAVGGRRVGLKYVGQYIASEWSGKARPRIMTDERIISLYADGTAVPYPQNITAEGMEDIILSQGLHYIARIENNGEDPPSEINTLLEKDVLTLEATFPYSSRKGKERHLSLYRTYLQGEQPGAG